MTLEDHLHIVETINAKYTDSERHYDRNYSFTELFIEYLPWEKYSKI